ncbi:MAG: hypothetical protein WAS94_02215 [Candidatus Saccharimonadales bacterium]
MKKKRILIVGSKYSGEKNDPTILANSITSKNTVVTIIFWEDIYFEVISNTVNASINNTYLSSMGIDLVIATGWYKNGAFSIYRDLALSLAMILDNLGVKYWNSEMGNQRSTTKLSATLKLALSGIEVIDTSFCLNKEILRGVLLSDSRSKWVLKAAAASRGRSNYLISNEEDFISVLSSDNSNFLLQPYIENDHDIRVICFGGKPSIAFLRSRSKKSSTHLNNTSKGGVVKKIELLELGSETISNCIKICKIFSTEMAGIDLMPNIQSSTGYSILEVNVVPQLTSGFDPGLKLKELNRSIEEYIQ